MSQANDGLAARFAAALPPLEEIDRAIYRAIAFGFPLLTMVIITGAVWAQHVWQRWWSWDPKETASLVTWLIYAGYLHGRRNRGWRGRTSARFAVLGFLAVLFTFAGVNFLNSLHSYGMAQRPEGVGLLEGFVGVSRLEAALTTGFFLAYLLAFLIALGGTITQAPRARAASLGVVGLGLVAHTVVLIVRTIEAQRLTFTSGYDFSLWFVWGITIIGFIVAVRGMGLALVASLPLSLLISMYGYLYFPHKGHSPLPPALQNKLWLHIHVALAIFAYGALALAAGWGCLYLLKVAVTGETATATPEPERQAQ
ncbi:MAG: cytochrome c biogenesis protein CcsA [Armatimonadetes bacterium]|nr:cytochrome c biogenesis protein CcsA [Armatimonadota bacterium]